MLMNDVDGKSKWNGYRTNRVLSCCIVLRRLATSVRWCDLEHVFGMHASALSELFWESVESFVTDMQHLLLFRAGIMTRRAVSYAETVQGKRVRLSNVVGFIDCTKIQMCRPGGYGSLQRTCYWGHKRFYCPIYQSVTTPDVLIFHLNRLESGRRHDITLYRQSGLDEVLRNCLLINRNSMHYMEIQPIHTGRGFK